jgi:hypothetical protein
MRALGTATTAELQRSGAYPGYLVQIVVASGGVVRVTSLDTDFDYAGNTFATADINVPDIGFDGTVSKGATLDFGDQTIAVWIGNLYREFDEAPVRIWQVYKDVPGVAEDLFIGKCGKVQRKVDKRTGASASIAIEADATALFSPRRRVQDFVPQRWLMPAGTVILINDQRWIIERPVTSNT